MCKNHKGEPFYITAPIYYPSANLHLGNTYTSIICDAVRRYADELGYDTYYVTGSDEHGEKLERAAAAKGKKPLEYIDPIVDSIKDLWKLLDVEPDNFVRSSSKQHEKDVQALFQKLYDKGDIYKGEYKGYYCTPCEEFWTEAQLEEGNCPSCGRPVEYREEASYFFRLSKYQDKLLKYYEDHPNFIMPENRKKEMIGSFFKDGLDDLSVTRQRLKWGVPVPFDPDHVIYVWIDALICYLTGVGIGDKPEDFDRYWPARVHFIGRDIARFHTIIWPAVLMALDLPLPEQVFAHGWILFDEDKMSKSKGNVIYPEPLVELYGRDPLKYFVLREFNFGSDGNFSTKKFIERTNSDLANDLGNLLSRTLAMVDKYREGIVPEPAQASEFDEDLKKVQAETLGQVQDHMEHFDFQKTFEAIWTLVRRSNKYIDETQPWILAKEEGSPVLDTVLYRLVDALRTIANLLAPFTPETSKEMLRQLAIEKEDYLLASEVDRYPAGTKVQRGQALFPRMDVEEEMGKIYAKNNALMAQRQGITLEELLARQNEAKQAPHEEKEKEEAKEEAVDYMTFDDFEKVEMKVGQVVKCEVHPDADKLLIETVDFGDETRTVVSGIREWMSPEEMEGKKFVFVTNLPPRKIRGIESQAMILTAEAEEAGVVCPLTPVKDVPNGSLIG
ncbi:methionine--tRNA ligase [Kallipyga massiliensis]|uniref:methionine--tRNA ligase n=1 Tax=Kallipyga massiliensis TaxID=1472764 RepID=UPI0026F16998|nr:methionine--tRNA ligase [Kallipyga massiliensis]